MNFVKVRNRIYGLVFVTSNFPHQTGERDYSNHLPFYSSGQCSSRGTKEDWYDMKPFRIRMIMKGNEMLIVDLSASSTPRLYNIFYSLRITMASASN